MTEIEKKALAMATCETCRFAEGFREPGPKPEVPPKPKKHWLWGGERIYEKYLRTDVERVWEQANYRHTHLVDCVRFPEAVRKRKSDWCGEHQPKENTDA